MILWIVFFLFLTSCTNESSYKWTQEDGYQWAELSPAYWSETGFKIIDSGESNINFSNDVSVELIGVNQIFLNGSGVAAGDIDGDGLTDLYFASLDGPN